MSGSWDAARLPKLTDAVCEIKSPFDAQYNCIAFVAGDRGRWWWPTEDDFWPSGVPFEVTFDAFVAAYATLGFFPCEDGVFETGHEKLALYGKADHTGVVVPTHAAIQLPNGKWASKLGKCEDVHHATVADVDGPAYGTVIRFLKRVRGLT